MNRKGFEQTLVVLLFLLVLVVFSFAERDSRKLDRLYKTTQLLQKRTPSGTVQAPSAPRPVSNN